MTEGEFLTTVKEQIRCQKAREPICRELQEHILSQAQDYERVGMEKDVAMEKAVREMGDPVEIGVAMDRIHRPRISFAMLALTGGLSIFSIVLHMTLNGYYGDAAEAGYLGWQIGYIAAGYLLMLVICWLDYSFLGKKSQIIAVGFLVCLSLAVMINPMKIGRYQVQQFLWLFVPIYGALLYGHRGQGYSVCWKMLLWAAAPMVFRYFLETQGIRFSISMAMMQGLSMALLFSVAVAKGWYHINKKAVLLSMWGIFLVLPTVWVCSNAMTEIQSVRLRAFLHPEEYAKSESYMAVQAGEILQNSLFFGKDSANLNHAVNGLAGANSDYVLVSLVASYGILAAALAVALLLWMAGKIFRISFGQKNQLGMIVGCGCGIVFLAQTLVSVLVNVNMLPSTTNTLPFFCIGGSAAIVTYILLGLVLSIYRYKDIPQSNVEKRQVVEHA